MQKSRLSQIDEANPNDMFVAPDFGGHAVSFTTLKTHERHTNDDRAALFDLGTEPAKTIKPLLQTAFRQAEARVRANPHCTEEAENGTTLTLAAYDPRQEAIHILSRGDSPAFVIVSDGHKSAGVMITSPLDSIGSKLRDAIHNIKDKISTAPPRTGGYLIKSLSVEPGQPVHALNTTTENRRQLHKKSRWHFKRHDRKLEKHYFPTTLFGKPKPCQPGNQDPIYLADIKQQMAEKFGMNADKMQATLVMGSDALDKGYDLPLLFTDQSNPLPNVLMDALRDTDDPNPSYRLSYDLAENRKVGDNTTVLTLPLTGKGNPIALMVADGFGKSGGEFAQEAMLGVAEVMHGRQQAPEAEEPALEEEKTMNQSPDRPNTKAHAKSVHLNTPSPSQRRS